MTTFDRTGATVLTSQCLKISEPISNLINGTMSGVVALGSGSSGNGKNHLEVIADLVDDFLAPHFECRIMGKRFGLSQELLYDPAIHASTGPAVMARKTLLQTFHNDNSLSMAQEEEVLRQHGFDFILAQVTDEKMVALARALRNHKFPFLFDESEANFAKLEEQTLGRSFVMYGGERDFLGAWTKQNIEHIMITSLKANVPYIQGLPKVWGKAYHFENCTKSNGMECGFLPMYGGHCRSKRIQPTMDCLGDMTMGLYTTIALPKQGIPRMYVLRVTRKSLIMIKPKPSSNGAPIENMLVMYTRHWLMRLQTPRYPYQSEISHKLMIRICPFTSITAVRRTKVLFQIQLVLWNPLPCNVIVVLVAIMKRPFPSTFLAT